MSQTDILQFRLNRYTHKFSFVLQSLFINYTADVFCTFYYGQVVVASCPGTAFDREPTAWGPGPLFVSCQGGQDLAVWTAATANTPTALQWDDLSCQKQPLETVRVLGTCGRDGKATEIEIGFVADDGGTLDNMSDDVVVTSITVCHDEARSQTLWARHTLWNEVAAGDHGNDSPPFKPDTFFDYDVNTFYTMNKQRETIAGLVGSQVDGKKKIINSVAQHFFFPKICFIYLKLFDNKNQKIISTTQIKKKSKFSSYIRKARSEPLRSHIHVTNDLLIYDFATTPI
jgi:hypothetical protein